ncbi:MAG: hypothetical protein U1E51_21300 [Candidatus Binatia bacterium]|nr:hypothetical protein [Candidatus Binatia bacterium]
MNSLYKLFQFITLNDVAFVLAAAALGFGLWLISAPLAFIVMGSLFLLLATWGKLRG